MTLLCYSRCSTCKKAEKWLADNKIEFTRREIVDEIPKKSELKKWHKLSGLPLKKFFNTSGMKYRELQLKDKLADMTDDEQYELLATDGMLVKRPLFVSDDFILVGFKLAEWEEKLLHKK